MIDPVMQDLDRYLDDCAKDDAREQAINDIIVDIVDGTMDCAVNIIQEAIADDEDLQNASLGIVMHVLQREDCGELREKFRDMLMESETVKKAAKYIYDNGGGRDDDSYYGR